MSRIPQTCSSIRLNLTRRPPVLGSMSRDTPAPQESADILHMYDFETLPPSHIWPLLTRMPPTNNLHRSHIAAARTSSEVQIQQERAPASSVAATVPTAAEPVAPTPAPVARETPTPVAQMVATQAPAEPTLTPGEIFLPTAVRVTVEPGPGETFPPAVVQGTIDPGATAPGAAFPLAVSGASAEPGVAAPGATFPPVVSRGNLAPAEDFLPGKRASRLQHSFG